MSRALWTAVSYDRPEVVRLLAEYGADLDALDRHGESALERASHEHRHGAIVACLLELGARDSLKAATRRGDLAAVQGALAQTAPLDPDAQATWLATAAGSGSVATLEFVLAQGIALNPADAAPLIHAVSSGAADVVERLLLLGANPNVCDEGLPLLGYAVHRGNRELVRVLLAHGADPNAASDEGSVRGALECIDPELARELEALLVEHGLRPSLDT